MRENLTDFPEHRSDPREYGPGENARRGYDVEDLVREHYGLKPHHGFWRDAIGPDEDIESSTEIKGCIRPSKFRLYWNEFLYLYDYDGYYAFLVYNYKLDVNYFGRFKAREIADIVENQSWYRYRHESMGLVKAADMGWRDIFWSHFALR